MAIGAVKTTEAVEKEVGCLADQMEDVVEDVGAVAAASSMETDVGLSFLTRITITIVRTITIVLMIIIALITTDKVVVHGNRGIASSRFKVRLILGKSSHNFVVAYTEKSKCMFIVHLSSGGSYEGKES